MDPLAPFQDMLARLADLSDEELSTLVDGITQAFDTADQANDATSMQALADALDQVNAEVANRQGTDPAADPAAQAPAPAAAAPMAASAEGETPPVAATEPAADPAAETPEVPAEAPAETTEAAPAAEGTPETAEKEQETTPVTASSTTVIEPVVPEAAAPVETQALNTIVAGADIQGYSAGAVLNDMADFTQAMTSRIKTLSRASGGDGEQVLVASIRAAIPSDQMLDRSDPEGNAEKIREATNMGAITAAGGCCSPLTTRYDLFQIGDTDRPIKGSLTGFGADRGGIRYFDGPTLSNLAPATGFWTCADDAAADATDPDTWKVCARVECPPESEVLTQAVTMCLTFGVIQSRVFPEMVKANTDLAMVAHARLAESALLAQIKAGSKRVRSDGNDFGMVREFLATVSRAAAYYRDRHRLAPTTWMRAILPTWLIEAARTDISFGPPSTAQIADNFGISPDEFTSFFRDRYINLTWTMDSPDPVTNGGGFYTDLAKVASNIADNATPLIPPFPSTVQWSLGVEGSWLFLDGGTLDLGIVRDSTLVRTNDYQTFTESFESVAHIGGESLWIYSPINVNGAYAGGIPQTATA